MTFCSELQDIPDMAGRVTRTRTQAISKRFTFNANTIKSDLLCHEKAWTSTRTCRYN